MERRIEISAASNPPHHFLVKLINTFGVVVAKYGYYNFIGNGDSLALACNEWANHGIFPDSMKGLVRIND